MSQLKDALLKLEALKLNGMCTALAQQVENEDFHTLSFEERLSH